MPSKGSSSFEIQDMQITTTFRFRLFQSEWQSQHNSQQQMLLCGRKGDPHSLLV